MHPIINKKSKFLPYDLCYIEGTKEIILITEVSLNDGQSTDEAQWAYSGEPITPGNDKCAWFEAKELKFIINIFDVIAGASVHPFSSGRYRFKTGLSLRRRK